MVMNSFIITMFVKLWQSFITLYNESYISRIVNGVSDWFTTLFSNSFILTFFIKPIKKTSVNDSFLIKGYKRIKDKYYNGIGKSINNWLSASGILQFYEKIDGYYIAVVFLVGSMVFIPTSLSMVLGAVVILFFVYNVLRGKYNNRDVSIVGVLLGMWIIVMMVSVVTAIDFKESAMIAAIYIVFLLALLTVKSGIESEKKLIVLLDILMIVLMITSLYGIYQYMVGVEVDEAWVDEEMFETIGTRIYSVFGNPNVFGVYLVMMVPIAGGMIFTSKQLMKKLLYIFAFGVGILSLALTYSRGSMIAVVFAIGIMLLFMDKRFIFLGVAGLVASPFILPDSIIQRLMSVGNMQETSAAYRVSIYSAALDMIRDFFFGGVGLGGFNDVYFAYAYSASKAFHAHNTFLMVFIELGVVGFALFITLLALWVKTLMSAFFKTNNPTYRLLILACVGGIAGASLQGLVEHIWFNSDVLFFYWFVVILGMIVANMASKKEVSYD